ncbi:rod shape-determining protein MreD [Clostridium cavendishii DSM 21758]|uniref:Rod shape-determining protein MreD n=1 Tax=Clostridium cavendishii DSM 21758 TaxID=1121302 RepID=A0A1M6BKG8_9CLOT|nr:rod shape-determining protein MreD [Clostridium cavendishii]SHI49219.1 rod shape-determining protein MreD [Clostridium cavendishii DSM 21758]
MKRFVLILLCLFFLVLDNTLMPFVGIKGCFPSLLFVFAILFSIVNGYYEAILIGSFSGIIQDIYFLNVFGINSITNLLLCLLAAYIGENILKHKKLVPVIFTLVITAVKYILVYILYRATNIKMNFDGIIIMPVYNMIIALLMYSWIYKISNKPYMKTEWKFNEK